MNDCIHFSNSDLIARVKHAAANERGATARLIALLSEFDERRLYLGEGCSSLFTYCTQALRLSEHASYGRIAAARASRRWPAILELLAMGDINLTTVVLLGPHLTEDNHETLLEAARGVVAPLAPERYLIKVTVRARRVPASVRRSVWQRDGGRCAFVGAEGRCTETGWLELHHRQPFADHGPTTIENLSLRCRAHNMHESRLWSAESNSV